MNSGSSSLSGFNFGLSPKFLSALSSLPRTTPPAMSNGLPSLSTQTTFHTSTSPAPTLMDSSQPSIDLASSTLSGITAVPVSAVDEFKQNTSLVVSAFIPRVQELARSIIQDLARSYEAESPSVQAASNIMQLKASLMELHSILRQSGIGSLPITLGGDGSASIGTLSVDEATANVGAAFNRASQCRENSTIVQNILEQELPASRRTL
ncbi:hypothetical protein RhiJN_08358 [Ceratobasidium sp. AG-Ba]|nr:hypothetical protein RhiJN_08358 [Ceratobasidium sp. AG-Ba]QRW09142.1 hypothetical protein RhiLY_08141 [Ceratobasidium sp. AG-Ba]